MLVVTYILIALAGFGLGYKLKDITLTVEAIKTELKQVPRKKIEEESKSKLIDPTDPIKEAQYQHKKMMKDLNGQDS